MAVSLVADTFSTDLTTVPANATLRNAGLSGGVAQLPTATAQGYVDFAFPGFNLAQPFTFESDVRLGRGSGPVPDGIATMAAMFDGQLGFGFGGADSPNSTAPMLLVFRPVGSLEAFVPTPFVFGDGQFHHLNITYDGISRVEVAISGAGKVFSHTLNHIFSPTSDLLLTVEGVNGMGGFNELDNLSFSSPGLEIVPEPHGVLLAIAGLLALGTWGRFRSDKSGLRAPSN